MSSTSDYRGQHGAPDHIGGAPLHDLTGNEVYPKDVYSYGQRYYGIGDGSDSRAWDLAFATHNRPRRPVTIYRAIPKSLPKSTKINPGDWVTPSRAYAAQHGRSALNGSYRIISKTVKAGQLFTAGDSILEWGYDPIVIPPAPPLTAEQRVQVAQRRAERAARLQEQLTAIRADFQRKLDDIKKRST
jgi:hypothetical protein